MSSYTEEFLNNEDNVIFDKVMKANDLGEIFIPEPNDDGTFSIESMLAGFYEGFSEGVSGALTKRRMDANLIARFNKQDKINAFATFALDRHIIGVNTGLIESLKVLFNFLMATPSFLPEIGDPALETGIPQNIDGLYIQQYSDLAYQLRNNVNYEPKCPIRAEYANKLLSAASEFIFVHEVAHITGGHTDATVNERIKDWSIEDKNLFNQCKEFDADLRSVFETIMNIDINSTKEDDRLELKNGRQALKGSIIAIFAFFRMIDKSKPGGEDLKGKYPPTALRQRYLANGIRAFSEILGTDIKLVKQIMKDAVIELESGLQSITDNEIGSILGDNEEYKEHYKTILEFWPKVYDVLKDLSYTPLPMYMS